MDVGASTGGFTDCMLQHGAAKVYAVDVGHDQLAQSLREDDRVINWEGIDIRNVSLSQLEEPIQFFSVDVSFISLNHVLPAVTGLLQSGATGVVLIKPQFEAGRENVGKNGLVLSQKVHIQVIRQIVLLLQELHLSLCLLIPSPIQGGSGNIEYLAVVKKDKAEGFFPDIAAVVEYAFSQLSELIGNPDERNFGKELESCHLNEFELMMEIDKDTLSKGETQVFVMSLYWAMMQQCKCELPFIIDTPFARIDTDHRANIVEQFFKRLPGQLFVLSTNEEISSKHMLALHDQTSNIFLLEYGDDKCTHIMNNQYFEV